MEVSHGVGGRLIDSDGNEYVDFLSGWGTNILGHGYPVVADAIKTQAGRYTNLGLSNDLSGKLSRLLCKIIPWADAVKFGKNGSDVTLGALRLARAVTGRQKILYRGYHGFHDWYMAGQECNGIPHSLKPLVRLIPDLSLNELDTAFNDWANEISCVIIDPGMPPVLGRDTLQAIIDITHSYGALIIFDEIGTGFRLAPGGIQELLDVQPDLACFGKAIANGMPLSVLAGKKEYMSRIHETQFGMTSELESISIAAALATISEIIEKNVCAKLWKKGERLKNDYERIVNRFGIATKLIGPEPRSQLHFEDQAGISGRELRWLCIQELVSNGILTLGSFLLCYSHSEGDMQKTADALEKAIRVIKKALEKGSVEGYLDRATYYSLR
jgi:glutamate-1-semialdehyde 2,1-aminomutase